MVELLFSLSPQGILRRPAGKAVGVPTPATPRLRGLWPLALVSRSARIYLIA